jgi:uncharacterized protein (TIGR03067 family)
MTVFALALVAASFAADPNAAAQQQLQGVWEVQSFIAEGQRIDEMVGSTIEFAAGGKLIHRVGKQANEGRYVLNAAQDPQHLDMITKGPGGRESKSLGIFEIADDVLRIAGGVNTVDVSADGKVSEKLAGRPAEFDPGKSLVITLKRVKE